MTHWQATQAQIEYCVTVMVDVTVMVLRNLTCEIVSAGVGGGIAVSL